MATDTWFVDNTYPITRLANGVFHAEAKIDTTKHNITAGDTVQFLKMPADCVVTQVLVILDVAEGATLTMTVGDGDAANGWDASVNLNATANTIYSSLPGTDAYATSGRLYAAADTIDGVFATESADTAVFTVHAIGFMLDNAIS